MADRIRLITPEATLHWAYLFRAREPKKGSAREAMYMCDLVFTPAIMQTPEFQAMRDAAQKVAKEAFGDKLAGLIAADKFINPFWKVERKIDAATGKLPPGYEAGGVYITIKSKQRPGIVKPAGGGFEPILDENEIYPGCIVRASVDVWAYDNESKGVSFGLSNILKVRDGERLGGGRPAAQDDFAALAGTLAAAAGTPAEDIFGAKGLV